jgi:hypothetical protein
MMVALVVLSNIVLSVNGQGSTFTPNPSRSVTAGLAGPISPSQINLLSGRLLAPSAPAQHGQTDLSLVSPAPAQSPAQATLADPSECHAQFAQQPVSQVIPPSDSDVEGTIATAVHVQVQAPISRPMQLFDNSHNPAQPHAQVPQHVQAQVLLPDRSPGNAPLILMYHPVLKFPCVNAPACLHVARKALPHHTAEINSGHLVVVGGFDNSAHYPGLMECLWDTGFSAKQVIVNTGIWRIFPTDKCVQLLSSVQRLSE